MKVRVLFSTLPGLGHFHPMVPLAQAIAEGGHEVAFATSASFCPTVASSGFRSFPAGTNWNESEAATTLPAFLSERPEGQIRLFVGLASKMADDLVEIADDWQADVFIREPSEFGAWVAAERLGLPHITCGIMLRLPGPVLNMFAGPQFAGLLTSQRLPADPNLDSLFRHLYLDFMPASFVPEGWPRAPTVHHVRPVPFDRSGDERLPDWAHRLGERPVVYATLGTVFNQAPAVFRCVIDAMADTDVELVVTVGRNGDPESFGRQPSNVHLERYIPQSELLPLCDAVICHAGYGTLIASLTNGIPVCCLPIGADQGFSAQRCAELGLGVSLATHHTEGERYPHLGPSDLDSQLLREAVWRLLEEPGFRSAAAAVRAELEGMPGVEHAVALVEAAAERSERR
jgi:UDP:flavonoid glycosyltransferase YjiC (YdhE family)